MSVISWYLSKLPHWWLYLCFWHPLHSFSGSKAQIFLPPCSRAKLGCLHLKLPFVPVSNSWITSRPSLRGEERKTEDVEKEHKDSTVPKHLPLKGPQPNWTRSKKNAIEREKPAPVAVLSTNDKRSVFSVHDGVYQTRKLTHNTHRNQTGIPAPSSRQVPIKIAKPLFSSPCAPPGRGQETEYERRQKERDEDFFQTTHHRSWDVIFLFLFSHIRNQESGTDHQVFPCLTSLPTVCSTNPLQLGINKQWM